MKRKIVTKFILLALFLSTSLLCFGNVQETSWDIKQLIYGNKDNHIGRYFEFDGDNGVGMIPAMSSTDNYTAVFYHKDNNGSWEETQRQEIPSGIGFPINSAYKYIGISGRRIIFGGEGKAIIYHKNGDVWSEETELTSPEGNDPRFGTYGVVISGNYAIAHTNHSGYMYERNGNVWKFIKKLPSSLNVAISGDYFVLTHVGKADVYFKGSNDKWDNVFEINHSIPLIGKTVAIDGDYIIMGGNKSSDQNYQSIYTFHKTGVNTWEQGDKLIPPEGYYPSMYYSNVCIDLKGNYAITADPGIGHTGENKAYIYYNNAGKWEFDGAVTFKIDYIRDTTRTNFALGVAISKDGTAVVTAPGQHHAPDNPLSENGEGALYFFTDNRYVTPPQPLLKYKFDKIEDGVVNAAPDSKCKVSAKVNGDISVVEDSTFGKVFKFSGNEKSYIESMTKDSSVDKQFSHGFSMTFWYKKTTNDHDQWQSAVNWIQHAKGKFNAGDNVAPQYGPDADFSNPIYELNFAFPATSGDLSSGNYGWIYALLGPVYGDSFRIADWETTSKGFVDNNDWHLVSMVYTNHDEYGWSYSLYIDGQKIHNNWHEGWKNSYGSHNSELFSPKGNIFIGASDIKGRPSDFYKGSMAEISVYDQPLTDGQIRSLYETQE